MKPTPIDPVNQFACDGCGRIFNVSELEKDGQELCSNCHKERGGKPSLPETRIRKAKERAVAKAEQELTEATELEKKAVAEEEAKNAKSADQKAQGAVSVPKGGTELKDGNVPKAEVKEGEAAKEGADAKAGKDAQASGS